MNPTGGNPAAENPGHGRQRIVCRCFFNAVSAEPVAAGTSPYSVTVDPWVKFAYVAHANPNNVSAYTINATTGAFTNIGAAVAAGSGLNSITTSGTIQSSRRRFSSCRKRSPADAEFLASKKAVAISSDLR